MALEIRFQQDAEFLALPRPGVDDELRQAHEGDQLPAVVDGSLGVEQGANKCGKKGDGQQPKRRDLDSVRKWMYLAKQS